MINFNTKNVSSNNHPSRIFHHVEKRIKYEKSLDFSIYLMVNPDVFRCTQYTQNLINAKPDKRSSQ